MSESSSARITHVEADRFVDRWLRLDKVLDRQYDAENDAARSAHLRETLYVGLILFNLHNLTNAFLLPDILWIAVSLRLFVVTPAALLATLYFEKMSSTLRERTVLFVVTSAFFIEIILFWTTQAPLGGYSFSEFGLTLVYGNMLMALRFRHAVIFTALSFLLAAMIVWQKPSLEYALRLAFVVQIAMACIISLYANYKTERRRCLDYAVAHFATMRADNSESARLQFQSQSRTDVLTGLPNRRLLDERLATWFAADWPVVLMMIDIDHFKLFNDTLGHPEGDDCLKQIGAVLAMAQAHDVLCARFGGEEFTVALQSADELGAIRLANRLVKSIEALGIVHPGRSDGIAVVTASVGVAFRQSGKIDTPQAVLAAADRALYRAKRKGRNCYVLDDLNHLVNAARV